MSISSVSSSQELALLLQSLNSSSTATTTSTDSTSSSTAANEAFAKILVGSLDTDGDGKVSTEEAEAGTEKIQEMLQSLNQQSSTKAYETQNSSGADAVNTAFSTLDTNNDGQISEDELASALGSVDSSASNDTVTAVFDQLDTNGNGSISKDELDAAIKHMNNNLQTVDTSVATTGTSAVNQTASANSSGANSNPMTSLFSQLPFLNSLSSSLPSFIS